MNKSKRNSKIKMWIISFVVLAPIGIGLAYSAMKPIPSPKPGPGCTAYSQSAGNSGTKGVPPEMQKELDELHEMRKQAEEAVEENNYDKAIEIYQKILVKFPGNAFTLVALGEIFDKVGRYEESYKAYHEVIFDKRIISTFSSDPKTLDQYASVCEKLGKEKEAYEGWQMIIDFRKQGSKSKRNSVEMLERHASKPMLPVEIKTCAKLIVRHEYYGTGKDKDALRFSLEATRLMPDFSPAYYYLGVDQRSLRKYQESLTSFRKALIFCKNDPVLEKKIKENIKEIEMNLAYLEKESQKKKK